MRRKHSGPRRPRRDDFPSWDAYRDAVEAYGLAHDTALAMRALIALPDEDLT